MAHTSGAWAAVHTKGAPVVIEVQIGWLITILVGGFGLIGALAGVVVHRLTDLENRVERAEARVVKAEKYNRRLWEWARKHIDLYYRHRRDGSPDPYPLPDEDE